MQTQKGYPGNKDSAQSKDNPASCAPPGVVGQMVPNDLLHGLDLCRSRLWCGFLSQKPAYTDTEQTAQSNKFVDFRNGSVTFPFGNGLTGNAQLFSQCFLGKPQHFPLPGDPLAQGLFCHRNASFLEIVYRKGCFLATMRDLHSVNRRLRRKKLPGTDVPGRNFAVIRFWSTR